MSNRISAKDRAFDIIHKNLEEVNTRIKCGEDSIEEILSLHYIKDALEQSYVALSRHLDISPIPGKILNDANDVSLLQHIVLNRDQLNSISAKVSLQTQFHSTFHLLDNSKEQYVFAEDNTGSTKLILKQPSIKHITQ